MSGWNENDCVRDTEGRFARRPGGGAGPKAGGAAFPYPDTDGGSAEYVLCESLDDWRERRRLTPGCSDMKRLLLDGRRPEPFEPEPGSYTARIFEFGHKWEPRVASEYARRQGLRERPEDTPIGDLRPGEITRHNLALYELDGKVHASLDAVQRNLDGTVTVVEIKTGARKSPETMRPDQWDGYLAQATVERLVTGADSARIVYAQRPYHFDEMGDEETARVTLGGLSVVDVDDEAIRHVRLHDGSLLSDLDVPRLERACDGLRG